MCIIVYKPKDVSVDLQTLETCYQNNPDGAGIMYPADGKLAIRKGYFTFKDFVSAWLKIKERYGYRLPVVFHFRIATAGRIDTRNCHPHRIADDLGFVHNGILHCIHVPKGSGISDTILYRDRYLGRLKGKTLHNSKLMEAIGRHIGPGNKFVFMNGRGKVAICNEDQGTWRDDLWFSNTSFLSRQIMPFPFQEGNWVCEFCGTYLDTPEEFEEGMCQDCKEYFEPLYEKCGGCNEILPSYSHRHFGWCDDCGKEIYGKEWPVMMTTATTMRESIMDGWL